MHDAEAAIRAAEDEIAWEIEAVDRGVKRYRDALAEAEAARGEGAAILESTPGKTLVNDVMETLVPAVQAMQQEALQGLTAQTRGGARTVKWWLPILCLEADKIAYITLRTALTARPPTTTGAQAAMLIAARIKEQREFDLWKEQQRERGKSGEPGVIDLYKLMLRSVKEVNQRTARKWMKLSAEFDRLDWSLETKVALGNALLFTLVTHGNGWFEFQYVPIRSSRRPVTERRVCLTEAAQSCLADLNAEAEVSRPWLMPMIHPPKPWRKE